MKLILVVDDNSDLCRTCMMVLSSREYSVVIAGDGARALQLLRSHQISLLLTDLVMPECDGNELIDNVRREFPHVPIVAMSGGLDAEKNLRATLKLGATRILQKPFEVETLLATVEQSLTKLAAILPGRALSPAG